MQEDLSSLHDSERAHHDAFYTEADRSGFFERMGFQHLVAWNLVALRRLVPLTSSTRLLSIGCGLGDYELRLAREVRSVLAFDLSPVAVDIATRRARAEGLGNAEFRCSAGINQEVPPASVDVVVAFGVFHHLSPTERQAILRQAHAWLVPGGAMYVRDPSARGVLRRTLGPLFRWWCDVHTEDEVALDPVETTREFRQAGFVDLRTDYVDVIGGPLPWLLASRSPLLWRVIFAIDRLWLATPLRRWASQFAVVGRRPA